MQETWVLSLGWEDPLEKGTATHSSILAWRIPWTVESVESQTDMTEQLSLHWHLGEGHGPRVILLGHHSQTVSVLLDVVCLPGIKSMTWLD